MRRNQFTNTIKAFVVLALLGSTLFCYSIVKAADPTIVSVIAPERVNQGQTFVVSIAVTPDDPIAGMQFDLSFDSSLVTAVQVEEGNLLSQGGASIYFAPGTIETGVINDVSGVIITPGQAVSTAGTFATITFTASTTAGSSALTLSNVVVGDIDGQSLPVVVINGQVGINSPPAFDSVGDKTTDEGMLIQFTVSATDADDDDLEYSALNLPPGAIFDPESRIFSWTPNYAQAGTYSDATFQVTDGYSNSQEIITITVDQPYLDWDVNADNYTNVLDMIRIGQHWGETGVVGWIAEDVNEDETVNVLDMILIGQNWTG
ncbi:putative Ig domain-containing protein [Chloroflexota bacterium]